MKILSATPQRGINIKHRKEEYYSKSYIGIVVKDNAVKEIVDLRLYETNAMSYCCIWVHDNANGIYSNGSGSANGYGYHKPSAAANEAIRNAGYVLGESIDGRGDNAIREAVEAICKYYYPAENVHVIHTHG